MTLLLRHPDLIDLLTQDEVIQAVRASLVEQAEGQVQVPNRITVDSASGHGWLRLMPAIMNRSGYMGFKAMNATPGRGVRYMVALYELSSGALWALKLRPPESWAICAIRLGSGGTNTGERNGSGLGRIPLGVPSATV